MFALILVATGLPAPAEELTLVHRQWAWTSFGFGIGSRGFEIVDLDGDATPEILATAYLDYAPGEQQHLYWYVASLDGTIHQEWTSFGYGDHGLRDITTDSTPAGTSIVVAARDEIQVFEGSTLGLSRTIVAPSSEIEEVLVVRPLPSGAARVFTCDATDLHVLDFETGSPLVTLPGMGCRGIASGQADSDAEIELALVGAGGAVILDSQSLAVQWSDSTGVGGSIALSDVDGDGDSDVVYPVPALDAIVARDPSDGSLVWEAAASTQAVLAAFDLDGVGRDEIVLTAESGGPIRVLDGSSGADLWSVTGWDRGAIAIGAGDANGDGSMDLYFSSGYVLDQARILAIASSASHELIARADASRGPYAGLDLVDLDADGDTELVAGSSFAYEGDDWGAQFLGFAYGSGRLESRSPLLLGGERWGEDSLAAQLDLDPQAEVCMLVDTFSTIASLHCADGLSFETHWQVHFPENVRPVSLLAADFDGDLRLEVAVGTDQPAVYVLEGDSGWPRFRTAPVTSTSAFAVLRAASVGAPGDVEIVVGGRSGQSGSGFTVFDGASGSLLAGPFDFGISALDVYDIDQDQVDEIFVGTIQGVVAEFDLASGTMSAPIVDYAGAIGALRVGDINRDGSPDFLTSDGLSLTVYGGAEDAEIWSSGFLSQYAGPEFGLRLADFDRNSVPEIAVSFDLGIALFEGPLVQLFADGFESGDTSAWSSALP